MVKHLNFAEKPDWRVINYLEKARAFVREKSFGKALKNFRKAFRLPSRREDKLLILDQMQHWARHLEDYDTLQECYEGLCEIELTIDNVRQLVELYIKTNNTDKRKALAEKVKLLSGEEEADKRNIITLLAQCDSHDEVVERCVEWLKTNPEDIGISKRVIDAYMAKGKVKDAIAVTDQLKEKGHEEEIYEELHNISKAVYDFETAKDYLIKNMDKCGEDSPAYNSMAHTLMTFASYSGVLTDEEYIKYGKSATLSMKPAKENAFKINPNYFRKIKVGFISYDFRRHSVGKFVMSLFDQMKGNTPLETFCYYTYPDHEDDFTMVIKERADHFRSVGRFSDKQLREVLLKDDLDILIDLNGQTVGTKINLIAERFAPIQMTWMGFPFSAFTHNIDYIIGDKFSDPEDGDTGKYCAEKPIRMNPCYMCFAFQVPFDINKEPPVVTNGYITFCNMSNVNKYSEETIRLWAKVLDKVPNSRLHIQDRGSSDNEFVKENLLKRFEKFGLDIGRVDIGDWYGNDGYWRTYSEKADIMLETIPFCGVTTAAEAIYCGVPLITYKYRMRHGRMSYDFQEQVGLGDLSGSTDEEYVEAAFKLAQDVDRLRDIRENGRERALASPLFDTMKFRTGFEEMIVDVYLDYCNKNKLKFAPYIYYEKTGALLADCIRVPEIIESLSDKGLDDDAASDYFGEYLEMLGLLMDEFAELYGKNQGALVLLNQVMKLADALAQSSSTFEALQISKVISVVLHKFV
jgi:predicted O-linked N-acetylglucosamine transferase (SPINDLY family)